MATWTFAPNGGGEEHGYHNPGVETFKGDIERYLARETIQVAGASPLQSVPGASRSEDPAVELTSSRQLPNSTQPRNSPANLRVATPP